MDPIDLDHRVNSKKAEVKRAEAVLVEAEARQTYAKTQANRYQKLFQEKLTSDEIVKTKQEALNIAEAVLSAAKENLSRAYSDSEAMIAQRKSLNLIAPADGIVSTRHADPGTTIVAGQSVVEIIDPDSLWINVRFDQISAMGLEGGLPAQVVLRSHGDQVSLGRVLRVELNADAVTEEILAKVVFDIIPKPLPPIGELAEVTVDLPPLKSGPSISNAAIRRDGDNTGVWKIVDGDLVFTPVKLGAYDLEGSVQVKQGLKTGDQVVIYSEKALTSRSRIYLVDNIPGTPQ
jgi:RND family efflux transporter MFP subunit